jgi:hypothetical protein
MQILKEPGIDWRERTLIKQQYIDQSGKLKLDQGETRREYWKRS